MALTLDEVARILETTEKVVWNTILSGKLAADLEDNRWVVSPRQLRDFLRKYPLPAEDDANGGDSSRPAELDPDPLVHIAHHLSGLQEQIRRQSDWVRQQGDLLQDLRKSEEILGRKSADIERLQRDLLYQKRLCDKEMEDQRRALEEKWALLERETAERLAQERGLLENHLASEQNAWIERLAKERELWSQKLAQTHRRESLWSRLVRMMTWS